MPGFGNIFVVSGIVMVVVGCMLMFFDKIPLLGKLPGDIHIKKDHTEFYFPIVASLALSLPLSGDPRLFSWVGKKSSVSDHVSLR
jgi:hypothetical protein